MLWPFAHVSFNSTNKGQSIPPRGLGRLRGHGRSYIWVRELNTLMNIAIDVAVSLRSSRKEDRRANNSSIYVYQIPRGKMEILTNPKLKYPWNLITNRIIAVVCTLPYLTSSNAPHGTEYSIIQKRWR
jgi:hypothetical protein